MVNIKCAFCIISDVCMLQLLSMPYLIADLVRKFETTIIETVDVTYCVEFRNNKQYLKYYYIGSSYARQHADSNYSSVRYLCNALYEI